SFQQALGPFLIDKGLPFAEVLSAAEVEQAFTAEGITFGATKQSVFTPALILWAFLSQALSKAKPCRDAVARVLALLVALHRKPPRNLDSVSRSRVRCCFCRWRRETSWTWPWDPTRARRRARPPCSGNSWTVWTQATSSWRIVTTAATGRWPWRRHAAWMWCF